MMYLYIYAYLQLYKWKNKQNSDDLLFMVQAYNRLPSLIVQKIVCSIVCNCKSLFIKASAKCK